MIDIHTHLYWESYDADRDMVVKRARETGVEKMICVGTSPKDIQQVIALIERYEGVLGSVGFHPHTFDDGGGSKQDFDLLRKSVAHPKVVAIGECGLDYFVRETPITEEMKIRQKKGFLAQIDLAKECGLPLIIHTRPSAGTMDAYQEMYDLLKATPESLAVLHCYQGDTEMTKKFLALPDVYFSFTGNITYPVKKSVKGTSKDPAEVIRLIPLARIFTETDCPFLAPLSHRGERNEPSYVSFVWEKLGEIYGQDAVMIEEVLRKNFVTVFGEKV